MPWRPLVGVARCIVGCAESVCSFVHGIRRVHSRTTQSSMSSEPRGRHGRESGFVAMNTVFTSM